MQNYIIDDQNAMTREYNQIEEKNCTQEFAANAI